jgi:hypothetical protein
MFQYPCHVSAAAPHWSINSLGIETTTMKLYALLAIAVALPIPLQRIKKSDGSTKTKCVKDGIIDFFSNPSIENEITKIQRVMLKTFANSRLGLGALSDLLTLLKLQALPAAAVLTPPTPQTATLALGLKIRKIIDRCESRKSLSQ